MSSAAASPTRTERVLTLLGIGCLVAFVAAWLFLPEPPMRKGGVAEPSPEAFIALAAGAFLALGAVRTVLAGWRARSWPLARGVVEEVRSLGGPYLYTLCRYTAGGEEHTLDAVRYGLVRFSRFRAGEAIGVRYDSADPSRAEVQPAVGPGAVTALVLGVFMLGLSAFSIAAP